MNLLLLLGPTIMIVIGLTLLENIPLTFLLFYGWLHLVPLLSKRNIRELFKNGIPNSKLTIRVGLITGIVCCIAIVGAFTLLFNYIIELPRLRGTLQNWEFGGGQLIWLVLILILINPLLEEWYWREFMYKKLLYKYGVKYSILTISGFYSLYHTLSVIPMFIWPLNIISIVPIFLAGVLWGYLRYKLNSIVAPLICHTLSDIGIMLVYFIHITPD